MLALVIVIVMLAGGLTYRMVDLQVVNPDEFVAWGESQRLRTVELQGRRGALLDRNGEQLAISIPQRTIWADPRLVTDPQTTAAELALLLGLPEEQVLARLTTDAAFVYIARQVDDERADAVEAAELSGVFSLDEARRFNPSGEELARAVVGTVGIDHDGLSGLELQYDDVLSGATGQVALETAPDGQTIASGGRAEVPAQPGSDLVLSIDRPLQFEVERMLMAQVEAMGAKGGVVVVMNPGTGEMLAMASVDRDDDGRAVPAGENRAVTWAFEPGSITKPLTFAAVLEEGVATPESVREVPSTLQLYEDEFSDSSPHETARWSVAEILVKSSNIGTTLWAMDLGAEAIDEYFRELGFGTPTALDAVGESDGILIDLDQWSGTSIATIPIGQGISVTSVQMLSAFNVIANGGLYVPPRLVLESVDALGRSSEIPTAPTRRVVSENTTEQLQVILADVVESGTGQRAVVPGYTVGGKTGTARKPQPGGGYEDGAGNYRYTASFAGFLPAEAPELSILVTIDEPSASIYGGYAAAPLFAQIAQYAVRRFQIPPAADAIVTDAEPEVTPEPIELVRGSVAQLPPPPEVPDESSSDEGSEEGSAEPADGGGGG